MTNYKQSNNSTNAAKRFMLRQLLRSAIAAGIVASFASSAPAQTELVLPSFPERSAALSLPVSQNASFPFAFAEQKLSYPSTAKRVAVLLGLKKQTPTYALAQSVPAVALPSFPSVEPTLPATDFIPGQAASNSHAPTIFRSTSGKTGRSQTEHFSEAVVPASADESLSQVTVIPTLVPPTLAVPTALALDEPKEESLDVYLSDSLPGTLIDIEIPKSPVQEVQQRLPELVRRSPAIQLRVGGKAGGRSTITDAEQQATASTNFSLSDSSESDPEKNKVQKPSPNKVQKPSPNTVQKPSPNTVQMYGPNAVQKASRNVMNVRIEGEPAQVVARAAASLEVPVEPQKKSSFDPSSISSGNKPLSDKSTDRPPTIGERLEVGLHESVNVETAQPISGLSVEHPELCQVLKSGERSVSFVGLKAGQTRVALFTTNASGERKIEIREVVIAGAENRQADMKSLASEIGESVHRMYPNSHIEVIAEAEGLTVQGYAASEAEAKKIISLVRRTSLQPVVDRLATYK